MKYSPPKLINDNIVIIDGISRSGKLLTGTIVSSFSNTEQFEMGRNFEDIVPGIKFKKIDIYYAEAFLKNYLNELIYNKYLSRNVNFRESDRTGVKNSPYFYLYKKRIKIKEGDKVIDLIKFHILKSKNVYNINELISFYKMEKAPVFPFNAKFLKEKYNYKDGKLLGDKLKQLETAWLSYNFKLADEKVDSILRN